MTQMDRYIDQMTPYLYRMYFNAADFIVMHTDILILMFIGFILAIWIVPESRSTSSDTTSSQSSLDIDNDFNFLATHESIPAQFDLALAFASMRQLDKALQILHTLSLSTHPDIRTKAINLQETLKAKSDALESQ